MQGLKQLEYRGYDSSGIAFLSGNSIRVYKKEGKLSVLENFLPKKTASRIGIGHTRWATHGLVSDINAHPHLSGSGRVAVIHNGIIDNFAVLKNELMGKGYNFVSDTDTEVLAQLIDDYYEQDPEEAVQKAVSRLEGTYGLVVIFNDQTDLLMGARNGSPLVVGVGDGEMFLASDAAAFIGLSRQAIFLEDGELVIIRKNSYRTVNQQNLEIKKEIEEIDIEEKSAGKGAFPHFMLKEIFEQPESITRALGSGGRLIKEYGTAKLGGLNLEKRDFFDINHIRIIGMGTAYYAGMVGASCIESLARIPVTVSDASELKLSNPIITRDTLYLAVSQSGETADTIAAVKEIQNRGGRVLGIVNSVGSTLARMTEGGVYIHAGREVSVASTKVFTAQVTVLFLLALLIGRMRDISLSKGKRLVEEVMTIPEKLRSILMMNEEIKAIAATCTGAESVLFLSRGINHAVALEGALKLKEITYIHAEGFSAGWLKHGPLALVSKGTPCVFIAVEDNTFEKTIGNIQEVKARQGRIILITDSDNPEVHSLADDLIIIPKTDPVLSPILTVVPLQLFSYYIAELLGRDIDRPRNLAKSVTTE